MEVRAKKALGQHFLTDLSIAQRIADALLVPSHDEKDGLHGAADPVFRRQLRMLVLLR
jgi:hypothetical protein